MELAQGAIVARHRTFALQHVDLNRRLVVGGGREDLRLLGRDGGVALDHLRRHAAHGLDPERQRSDVEQQQVFHLATQHAALNGCAYGNDFVRVHALVRLLAKDFLHQLLDPRHAGLAADQHHFVDLVRA